MTTMIATTKATLARRDSTAISRVTEMDMTKAGTKDAKTTRTIFRNQTGDRPAADISNGWDPWRCTRMPIVMVTVAASVLVIKAWTGAGEIETAIGMTVYMTVAIILAMATRPILDIELAIRTD